MTQVWRGYMTSRKLPIGIQSFEKIITNNYIYIDKTRYIYDLVHSGSQFFLSRPRRFGKSLLLSTLKEYWKGNKELFSGLQIDKLEQGNSDAWQRYPVFYFDFNGQNYQNKNALENILDEHLTGWEKEYGCNDYDSKTLEERFRDLLKKAYTINGLRSVVLVDEYDKPLLETENKPELEEYNKAVFKGFFGSLKGMDDYLQFVFVTGVTKFSKVSIFSDLNQLNDISMDTDYNEICGMTEREIIDNFPYELKKLEDKIGISNEACLEKLKHSYDGYHFSSEGAGIYNPYSVLCALQKGKFGYYWFETGTPSFLVSKLKQMDFDVAQFSNLKLYATEKRLSDYRGDNPDIVPLLYQTGYLTLKKYDSQAEYYALGFPNDEVKYGFLDSLLPEYTPAVNTVTGKDIISILQYVKNGDIDNIRDAFIALFAGITYTSSDVPYEHYFQTVIYLVFTLLGQYVKCEVHSYTGRADCVTETDRFVYIFEFKKDSTAKEALEQIQNQNYAKPYISDKRKVLKIGVNFDSESKELTEWIVE